MIYINQDYKSAIFNGLFSIIISFIISIITANYLSLEERGGVQLLIVQASIMSVISNFGLPFYNSHKINRQEEIIPDNFIFAIALAFGIPLFIFASKEVQLLNAYAFMAFSLSFLGYSYTTERLKNKTEIQLFSKLQIIQPMICLILLVYQIISKGEINIYDVAFSYTISYIISFIIFTKYSKTLKLSMKLPFNAIGKNFIFGYWFFQLSSIFVANIDKILIATVLNLEALGVYAVIQTVTSAIARLSERIAITYLINGTNYSYKVVRNKVLIYMIILAPIALVCGYIMGEYVYPFIFSEKYANHSIVSSIMFLGVVISSAGWIIAQRANIQGNPINNGYRNILSSIVFIFIFWVLGINDNLMAVSISYLSASFFRFLYSFFKE